MRIRHRRQLEAEIGEQRFDLAFHFETVLQAAGRVEGQSAREADEA